MQPIAVSHAKAFVRLARAMVEFAAQLPAYTLLAFGLGGAQIAEADYGPSGVPTIDLRSPTTASLRWGDHADNEGIQNRVDDPSATSTVESHFILNHLGVMYARGRGVPKSQRLVTKLFRQLAMDGYTPAMVNLGTLYERGSAGRRDHRRAYAWIRAALALGVPKEDYDATLFKLGMIAVHLGTGQTTSAERHALTIIRRIGERCEYSRTSIRRRRRAQLSALTRKKMLRTSASI
jgi:TPR repeat protein